MSSRVRQDKASGCDGKRRFESRHEADVQVRHLRGKLSGREHIQIYACTFCHGYHWSKSKTARSR